MMARHLRVSVPPEENIALEYAQLLDALSSAAPNWSEMRRWLNLAESMVLLESIGPFRRLRASLLPVLQAAGNAEARPADDERAVLAFLELAEASGYKLMTSKEWVLARAAGFHFQLPLKVNWECLDTQPLTGFWASTPERRAQRAGLHPMSDRALLLHRGMGTVTASGTFINEKIDLLLEYLIMRPARLAWHRLREHLGRPSHTWRAQTQKRQALKAAVEAETRRAEAAQRACGMPFVERRTLESHLPNLLALLTHFFTPLELQEPCLKDVIIWYRPCEAVDKQAGIAQDAAKVVSMGLQAIKIWGLGAMTTSSPPPPAPACTSNPPSGAEAQNAAAATDAAAKVLKSTDAEATGVVSATAAPTAAAKKPVRIHHFNDVPLGDMEVVFPEKKVFLGAMVAVQLVVTLVIALATFFITLASPPEKRTLSLGFVASAVSVVLSRCAQVYYSLQASQTSMSNTITQMLYGQRKATQEAVVHMMLEGLSEQRLKEVVLAYALLLRAGTALSAEEVEQRCQEFLIAQKTPGSAAQVEFPGASSLARLQRWGAVRSSNNGDVVKWEPVALKQATVALQLAANTRFARAAASSGEGGDSALRREDDRNLLSAQRVSTRWQQVLESALTQQEADQQEADTGTSPGSKKTD